MITLSYRRDDSVAVAGRLYDRLQAAFGADRVFMDFDSIPAGADFREHILRAIERSDLVVVLIGPKWLGEESDLRRIDHPDDFVRFEVSSALARSIPVIPVLVGQAPMPQADRLPADLRELAFRNALPLDSGRDFHNHAARIVDAIRTITKRRGPGSHSRKKAVVRAILLLVVIGVVALSGFAIVALRKSPPVPRQESAPGNASIGRGPEPASSPSSVAAAAPASTVAPPPAAPPASLKDFRGRWSSVVDNPLAGGGTVSVRDELVIDSDTITERISTEWKAKETRVFQMTLRIRFGELWVAGNELNARCLSAEVTEVFDPKEFGKMANIVEQTKNGTKAGLNLIYAFALEGEKLRRGATVWTKAK